MSADNSNIRPPTSLSSLAALPSLRFQGHSFAPTSTTTSNSIYSSSFLTPSTLTSTSNVSRESISLLDQYSNLFSRYDTVYSELNSSTNIDSQTKSRNSIIEHYDKMIDIFGKEEKMEMSEQMQILGFTQEEIDEFQNINTFVTKGRNTLLNYLKEHNDCETKSASLSKRIEDTKETLRVIRYNLFSLEESHRSFKDLNNDIIDKIKTKEAIALEELQSEQALLEIRKDKLECAIKHLLNTYNVLKSTSTLHMCPICLMNEIDSFIDPCGHTLCSHCCSKLNFCHMCRTKVKIVKSIYYS